MKENIQMEIKYIKRYSISYIIREIKIKAIVRYITHLFKGLKSETLIEANASNFVEQKELICITGKKKTKFGRQFGIKKKILLP